MLCYLGTAREACQTNFVIMRFLQEEKGHEGKGHEEKGRGSLYLDRMIGKVYHGFVTIHHSHSLNHIDLNLTTRSTALSQCFILTHPVRKDVKTGA
ncbi:hypothetical protein AVEN_145663-1 [Araneus ventricosus]|uniref:Uncharacterized protein n=1 Tax=Araneus ventricosus TaxID=182803 RepID=A0A4Y2KW23_ARAVE|nr:hypothetical protein AVEN_145663-1 [Araneus ventricosus]